MKKILVVLSLVLSFTSTAFANFAEEEEFIPENDSDYAQEILDPQVKSQMVRRAVLETQKRTKSASRVAIDQGYPKN
jgi:hypothetical protein